MTLNITVDLKPWTSPGYVVERGVSGRSVSIRDVDADTLDVAGGFDCIRLDGTGHAATASRGVVVSYILYGARYSGASPVAD